LPRTPTLANTAFNVGFYILFLAGRAIAGALT
jgi:hypothetical protein